MALIFLVFTDLIWTLIEILSKKKKNPDIEEYCMVTLSITRHSTMAYYMWIIIVFKKYFLDQLGKIG